MTVTGDIRWVKVHYLDASALVKLVADDDDEKDGRAALREFYNSHGHHYATSYCIAEALSAFKLKWLRKKITLGEYIKDVREFFRLVLSHLTVDEVPLSVEILDEADRLMKAHKIDFIDSIQLVTVLRGRFAHFAGESQSLFITADRKLAKAARKERVRVCDCTKEAPAPC